MRRGVALHAALFVSLFAALWSASALSAEPANFTGEWKLDKARSDSLEPMLVRCGFGWVERKAAIAFPSTVSIVHQGDRVHITNHTFVDDIATVAVLDDKAHTVKTPLGPMTVRARRTDQGAAIRSDTVTQCERNDVQMIMANERRFLKTKNVMLLVMDVTLEDGSHVKLRRVFARQNSK